MRATLAIPLGVAALGACLAGCTSSTTSSSLVAPSSTKCAISATNSTSSFSASGGSASVAVSASRDCTWSVAANSAWVSFSGPQSGQGDGVVPFAVSPNPVPAPRTASIVVGAESVPVNQAAAACTFALGASSGSVASAGGPLSVGVSTLNGCAWSAKSNVAWITIASGLNGNASGTIGLSVGANGGGTRTGTVTIGGQTFTVTQAAADAPPPPADPPPGPKPPDPNPPPPPPPPKTPIGVPVDFQGQVDNVSGGCPSLTFSVDRATVQTDGSTKYKGGGCQDLQAGDTVHVTGTLQLNTIVAADQVMFKKGHDD